MNKTLLWKSLFIIAVMLVFVLGIILGTDWQKNFTILRQEGLKAALQQNINLGLDLKGGTHLILQVHVNEAVNSETDRAIESLKEQLRSKNIAYADVTKPDPTNAPAKILIKGVPLESAGDLRAIVQDRLSDYDLTSGPENSWVLAMKPSKEEDLKKHAVSQAIETIRNRIDQLGVSEPVIEEHGLGQYQILVQLPGIDDPARVKQIMQSTAMLEIRQAIDKQPYPSEQAALQAHNGVLPSDAVILPEGNLMKRKSGSTEETGDQYWVISRTAAVSGNDLRDAQMTRDENNRPAIGFTLTSDGGRRRR